MLETVKLRQKKKKEEATINPLFPRTECNSVSETKKYIFLIMLNKKERP